MVITNKSWPTKFEIITKICLAGKICIVKWSFGTEYYIHYNQNCYNRVFIITKIAKFQSKALHSGVSNCLLLSKLTIIIEINHFIIIVKISKIVSMSLSGNFPVLQGLLSKYNYLLTGRGILSLVGASTIELLSSPLIR